MRLLIIGDRQIHHQEELQLATTQNNQEKKRREETRLVWLAEPSNKGEKDIFYNPNPDQYPQPNASGSHSDASKAIMSKSDPCFGELEDLALASRETKPGRCAANTHFRE